MRAIYVLVLIFNFFLLKGDGIVLGNTQIHTFANAPLSFHTKKPEVRFKALHQNSFITSGLNERRYDLTEDDTDDELVFESHSVSVVKQIALFSYAVALIFIFKNLKSRLSIFQNQSFTSTDKYIFQRVLRL
ncbi:hypothetical protein LZQ00_15275 [Sphingobacterium sp. SRCM116780]|uniref:hypothetical protein n=1 Tax=Sphingobacterium sp. SRCM116780 TaxID=2907623 RepID=UPI001F190B8A|nr:hypothetical protein [Sphingobacterium sp. SRCM116780]UIR55618.1 hypothetical protein LZQ00_15275 [Sphingobacterium sp. SRCM116780]